MEAAQSDMTARMLAEQKVEAARVLESVQSALATDAELLSATEHAAIAQALLQLQQVMQGSEVAVIEVAIKTLDQQTQEFAARRMDSSIRRALAGHSVDEV